MEIKSCPFCGSPGFLDHVVEDLGDYSIEYPVVRCSSYLCFVRGPEILFNCHATYQDMEKTAVDLWNSRVSE